MIEEPLTDPEGLLVLPDGEPRAAMLVLSGSSGRVEVERARVLASHGIAALSMRYFGGPGQPELLCEVPLESFLDSLARLHEISPVLGVLGTSKGAEAGLLLGVVDLRLRLIVGLAPSSLVWAPPSLGKHGRPINQSSWTWHGDPLHFMPYIDQTTWGGPELQTSRQVHEASLRVYPGFAEDATIAVEQITADVLLAAGGDDKVWPAAIFAEDIRRRRADHGLATAVVFDARAGHRAILPGEPESPARADLARGGSRDADRAHGQRALAAVLAAVDAI